ncbi:MAG: ATP-binding cassette domain-containing protein [Gammaproteobacteria bacterium]|nr:ATP-binding cassette domain-containing protein [Gammaproteobacteria bacterium]
MPHPLVHAHQIRQSFHRPGGQQLVVLDSLDLKIYSGEIVALLGKSGSGKSTLLRIIAGLVRPTEGQVLFMDQPVTKPMPGISMVFQSFALMPWLTVLQNVELGLESMGLDYKTRRERALQAIDMIGLDGFESAYPKELSGGMRQRVGFARALVVQPTLLLMDEPFSALDVLTAEALRKDLMTIWMSRDKSIPQAILFVTHNIEEAAEIADRILIFGSDPGYIKAELPVRDPFPRLSESYIKEIVDDVYFLMTTPLPHNKIHLLQEVDFNKIELSYRLPEAEPNELHALVNAIYQKSPDKAIDLPILADLVSINIDEFYSLTEAIQILHLAKISKGDITLTEVGKLFAQSKLQEAKKIFRELITKWVPIINHICDALSQHEKNRIKEEDIMKILEESLSEQEAERVFKVLISWGRYAELFAYDYESGYISLENPQ